MCISFALDTHAERKDLRLPALNEDEIARIDSSDKDSTDVVSPNHAKWKVHHVDHKEADDAPALRAVIPSGRSSEAV